MGAGDPYKTAPIVLLQVEQQVQRSQMANPVDHEKHSAFVSGKAAAPREGERTQFTSCRTE